MSMQSNLNLPELSPETPLVQRHRAALLISLCSGLAFDLSVALRAQVAMHPLEAEDMPVAASENAFELSSEIFAVRFDYPLSASMVDAYTGGDAARIPQPHPPTAIEAALLNEISSAVFRSLAALLPQLPAAPGPRTSLTFRCSVGGGEGTLTLTLPHEVFAPPAREAPADAETIAAIEQRLRAVEVEARLVTAPTRVKLRELLALSPDDCLRLELPGTAPLALHAAGAALAEVSVCARLGRKALKLTPVASLPEGKAHA